MPREVLPRIFRQDLTSEGISLELRWDPKGPLHLPGFLEQTRHPVFEVHRRHIWQAESGQHGDQRTEPELPHA